MLGDRIKELRKQKGYSQETLAQRMNVVRQTVSKWENGTSVPDAEMLKDLAEIFEVSVSILLGESFSAEPTDEDKPMDEVAKQLAILNDQLAGRTAQRRRSIKRWAAGILAAIVLGTAVWIGAFILFKTAEEKDKVYTRTAVECTLDGETYSYELIYDQNFRITESGGNIFIESHVQASKYEDANTLLAQIEDYFVDRGGTFKIVETSRENR